MPEMTKLSACSALLATRRRGIFFCCSNTASSVAPVSMRKVSTCNWPCSEAQRVPFGTGVILVASWPGRPTRAPVTGSSASRQPTSCLRGSTAAASAVRSSGLITPVTGFLCRVW